MNILTENFFDWFLSATLRGTLLAAAVLLIQFVLCGRLPAFWRHALWLPVFFVLASPVLPETRWSLESLLASPPAQVTVVAPSAPEVTGLEEMPMVVGSFVAASPAIAAAESPPLDTRVIASRVWLGGVILMLGIGLYGHARVLRRLRRGSVSVDPALEAELAGAVETAGLRRAPRLLVSASVASPAMTGVFRPLLLLPANFTDGYDHEERRLILLHELIHLRRGDLLINGLLFLLQALHWCNPLLWFAFARFRADREAACDSAVLATSAEDARQSYGHALLKLSGAQPSAAWSLGFVGVFGRGANLRSRVRAIATYRRAHPAWTLVAIALIGALTVAGGTRAEAEAEQQGSLAQTLEAVVLANVNFRDAALEDVIGFLRVRSRELDPEGDGVNFNLTGAAIETSREKKLTFHLSNVPLSEVVRYVADLAELDLRVEEQAVVLDVAQNESPEPAEKPGIGEGSTLNAKLESIVLPKLDLRDASLEETIGFLRVRLRELDPDKQGVNFVITSAAMEAAREKKITLQLSNVPFSEVLRSVAELAGLQVRTDQHAVVLEVRK